MSDFAVSLGPDQVRKHPRPRATQVTSPAQAAQLIDHLRAGRVTLTYDPGTRTLSTDTEDAVAVTVDHSP